MPRKFTGQMLERWRKRGRVYALRFRAYGERQYLTLGTSDDGWTRTRAEEELQSVLADVRRGSGGRRRRSPRRRRRLSRRSTSSPRSGRGEARGARAEQRGGVRWHLTHHLLPHFRAHRLSQITVREVERYKAEKLVESQRLRERRARGDRTAYRPLSPETINKTHVRLPQILEVAVEYRHMDRNPAAGRRRRLKVSTPQRSYLDRADQIEALLVAAGRLDASARHFGSADRWS